MLRARIREIAEQKRPYGCPRIYVRLRREGWRGNHKKVERMYYQDEGWRYGDAGGRNRRLSAASPIHGRQSRGAGMPWILCMTGS